MANFFLFFLVLVGLFGSGQQRFFKTNDVESFPFMVETFFKDYHFMMRWKVDWEKQMVQFIVHKPAHIAFSSVLVGFSDHGEFKNSDYCLVTGNKVLDGSIDNDLYLNEDLQQDCINFRKFNEDWFYFERDFVTCDPRDYAIDLGQSQFIVAFFETEAINMEQAAYKGLLFGKILNDQIPKRVVDSPNEQEIFFGAHDAVIPKKVTSYRCIVSKIDDSILATKHHMIEFKAKVTKGNEHLVHHMEVFTCIGSTPDSKLDYEGSCTSRKRPIESRKCSKVIGAWALGAAPLEYPEEAGAVFGGPNFPSYIMVEIHYNNEAESQGVRDSSGIVITYTDKLRQFDAAIMELGLIYGDANSIPPHQPDFPITGYCAPECTSYFPPGGIYLFATQMHAHLTGRKLFTSHFRDGRKIGEVNRADHYSPHWQLITRLKNTIHVKKGDYLATTCVYDTRNHTEYVFGGYGIEDEMCVNYVHYYPESEIEVCKSAVSNSSLTGFFEANGIQESHSLSIHTKYEMLPKSTNTFNDLLELYAVANLNMHCLAHDGKEVSKDVDWSNLPKPRTNHVGIYSKVVSNYECLRLND
uniref:DOMON domain-containing protein n=1 Tax=Rhabditophanes sp. KR3021 TaxID=114890 RepID=A0AC35TVU4_9BILA